MERVSNQAELMNDIERALLHDRVNFRMITVKL